MTTQQTEETYSQPSPVKWMKSGIDDDDDDDDDDDEKLPPREINTRMFQARRIYNQEGGSIPIINTDHPIMHGLTHAAAFLTHRPTCR